MLIGFVVLYLFLTLVVGFWASRWIKTTDDFTLAGRSLPALVVGVTIFATWFGPELIMGVPTLFLRDGVKGIITDLFGMFVCLSLVGFFYARQLYRLRIVTINDFFKLRFSDSMEFVTSLINVFTYFSFIAAQFLALALLFNSILGLPVAWGIIVGASVVLIYTYIGGMWAVSITDLIQTVMIVGGLLFVMFQLLAETDGVLSVFTNTPDGFYNFLPEPGFYSWMDYLSMWMVFGIGAIPAQEIYQRVLSARTERAGAAGAFLGAGMLFVIGSIPLIIALCISQVHPELLNDNDGQSMIPSLILKYMGVPIQIMFFGALISAILSTSSGAMLAPATVISENLIKPWNTELTDKQLLLRTRLCVVLVAVTSACIAFFNSSIHDLVVDSVTLYLVCLVVPFTFGLHWKKATVAGAWASIVVGGIAWLVCKGLATRIEPWMLGLTASLTAMIAVSLITSDNSRTRFEALIDGEI